MKFFYILLIIFFCSFSLGEGVTSKGITILPDEFKGEFIFDDIETTYEISSLKLKRGVNNFLSLNDALRIEFKGDYFYLVLVDEKEDKPVFLFPSKGTFNLSLNKSLLIDLNKDGLLDVELRYTSLSNGMYNLYVGEFSEETFIPEGDYFQLFDISVRLVKERVYSSREVDAFIVFENFGEGPSQVDIIYSIVMGDGLEVYHGNDIRVVETEEVIIKNFGFLNLGVGKYEFSINIYYGNNQEGVASISFEVVERPFWDYFYMPFIFGLIVVLLLIVVNFFKRARKRIDILEEDKFIKKL